MTAIIGTSVKKSVFWLKNGEPVALPTETVYGLAAPLFNVDAINKIYRYKNRPANNPLIVHVFDVNQASLIAEISKVAEKCIKNFWPGPLTIILKKKCCVPNIVTAGSYYVAIRCPMTKLFREVLKLLGCPIVAPSANVFQHVSPTNPRHVFNDLGNVIKYILNGGPCTFGVESTILSLINEDSPIILRPGPISQEILEIFFKKKILIKGGIVNDNVPHMAPGLYKKHYSTKTPLYLVKSIEDFKVTQQYECLFKNSTHVLMFNPKNRNKLKNEYVLSVKNDIFEAASNLFRVLQNLDLRNFESIWIEKAPNIGIGKAINDRLIRAAYVNLC